MKKILLLSFFIYFLSIFNQFIFAQGSKNGFNYQAVARDQVGNPIPNKNLVVEVTIRYGGASGSIVWQEGHNVSTNEFGLFSMVIGEGVTTGVGSLSSFSNISWGIGDYYIQIGVDFGNSIIDMGTAKFNYVPYAKMADSARVVSNFYAAGDVTGTVTNLKVTGIQGNKVTPLTPSNGQILKWNSSTSTWELSVDFSETYTAGAGLTLSGNTFINTAPNAMHTGDAIGSDTLTVVALRGYAVSTSAPANNNVLTWNGSAWTPAVASYNTYYAGTGLTLSGDTFFHLPHTGDAIGQTNLTVVALQNNTISPTAPVPNDVLTWNGTAWTPSAASYNTYYAGTGLILIGDTFYHIPHTGDAIGQTSLTVVALQNNAILATAPAPNNVLTWNGTAWAPGLGLNYIAGTGISITGDTITNSSPNATHTGDAIGSDVLTVVALQSNAVSSATPGTNNVLTWDGSAWSPAIISSLVYFAGTGIFITGNSIINTAPNATHTGDAIGSDTLTVIGIQGRSILSNIPSSGDVLTWNGTAWTPSNTSLNTYYAGIGLTLIGDTFSHLAHTGDAIGQTSLKVVAIQNYPIMDTLPATNNVLTWNGTAWMPSNTALNTYYAGIGLVLTGDTFSHLAHTGDALGQTSLKVVALQNYPIMDTLPATNNVLTWNGTAWMPSNAALNTYYAGIGLVLTGDTFSHLAHTGDALGQTSLKVVALQNYPIMDTLPATNNVLTWNGTAWMPSNAALNTYYAGIGLVLTGDTFSHLAHTGDALGQTSLTVVAIQNRSISANAPAVNNVLTWTGSAWTPSNSAINTYYAGIGLTLTGNTFSHSAHTGDALGQTSLTVVAIQNRSISANAPAVNNVLTWTGSAWTPSNSAINTYYAGIGLTLTGNTFSHSAHTGDALGQTSLTVVAIQNRSISANVPVVNNVLTWTGSAWTPSNSAINTYYAGIGLTLTGNTFSHSAHTGDALGQTSLTVVAIQNRSISANVPVVNNVLTWTGSAWTPSNSAINTYYAGIGLTLTGNTFSHSAHTGDALGQTSLTVVAIQNRSISANAPVVNNVLTWTGSAWTPSNSAINTYYAGIGLTLSGNTFSHSAHTGDALGQTSLTVVAIQNRSVSANAPAVNNVLTWTGSAWTPSNSAINTYYAGIGLTLTGNTFSHSAHTGDALGQTSLTVVAIQNRSISANAPVVNNVLTWTGSAWTPSNSAINTYYAGIGLTLTGNTFSHSAHTGDALGQTSLTVVAIQNRSISANAPVVNNVLTWTGSAWTPSNSAINTYYAGIGLTLSGNTFSHSAHTGDALGQTSLTVVAIQNRSISANAPVVNNVLTWTGSAWTPSNSAINTYYAGIGLTLSGNTFSHSAHTGDALGQTSLTVVAIQNRSVSANAPAVNNVLTWTGSAWTPSNSAINTYYAGIGLTLSGNTFSHSAHTGDALGQTSLTVVAIQDRSVSANAPAVNNVLTWTGAAWTPSNSAINTYYAGIGLTLTGNTFSHSAHTGDALGQTSLTVVAIQDRSVSANAPAVNNVLTWTGAAWTPSNSAINTYYAGIGLTLSGNTFSHSAHTGDALGQTSLTVVAIQNRSISANAPVVNNVLTWTGSAWTPSNSAINTYYAGIGLTLSGNTFSHSAHTGDALGQTSLTVVAIQNRSISASAPAVNNVLTWNGAAWAPSNTAINTYTAGIGLTLSGNTFSHSAHTGDALGQTYLTVVALQNYSVLNTAPVANNVLTWNGAAWAPANTTINTYTAGTGLTLSGNTFSHSAHTGDAIGQTSLTVVAIQNRSISASAPAVNNVLTWNGAAWAPSNTAINTYTAGIGLTLSGNTFSHSAHTGDALGQTYLTVVALQNYSVLNTAPVANNVLTWNGAAWAPANTTINTYTAGTGLTLSGNTFSHSAHTGDAIGQTSLTVVAIQNRSISASAPAVNNVLTWNGAAWAPSNTAINTYTAGIGLTLSGNTFSHSAHTGDALGQTYLTVVALQNYSVLNTAPVANNVLTWNGAAWAPANTTINTYTAGTGLTLSGNTFSHSAHTGDAIGQTSLTVVAIQNRSISASAPAVNNVLTWTGAAWAPSNTAINTYTAGIGLTLSGNTFSHSAHTGDALGQTYLTVVALQNYSVLNTAPVANNVLTWNGAAWAPANTTINTYTAGTGLTLSGNTFSHSAHTGDAIGQTSLTVVAIQNRSISASAPAVNNVLTWNGAAWAPSNTAINTYTAGIGLTLSGNTFSHSAHTGDALGQTYLTVVALQNYSVLNTAPVANNVLTWNGAAWAPANTTINTYTAGTGLTLSGNTFSHSAHTGDAIGQTSLTVVAIQNRSISASAPAVNNVLTWNGAAWAPSNTAINTYTAGIGLTLSGNTFSHSAHTGDALGQTYLTVVALQNYSVLNTAPVANNVLTWNGAAWAPANTTINTYTAGTGLTLSGNTFSHSAHTGDAIGQTSLTVVAIQNRSISASAPAVNNVLTWTGAAWAPSNTAINTYTAGIGLTLSGNTFSHSAHTGDALGQTYLTVVALQNRSISASAPAVNNVLTWTGAAWTPSANAGQPYYAGTGLSLSGNTFINTAPALVGGSGTTNQVSFWTTNSNLSSDANLYWDNTNKRLGIGTATPSYLLDIAGNLNFTGVIYKGGSAFIHNTGNNNTFTGLSSGNLTATGTGNTGTGFGALTAITTGTNNVALGYSALTGNTSASENIAVGVNSLQANSGDRNIGIGNNVLHLNSGHDNTGVGYYSLAANTSGSDNLAIGSQSLANNQTGINNTGIGFSTLATNVTGSRNTAIGFQADILTDGISNSTAIGNGAIAVNSDEIRLGNASVTSLWCMGATKSLSVGSALSVSATGQIGIVVSSMRYKENITDIALNTSKIYDLRPVSYTSKIDHQEYFGLIAEEVEKIFPDMVDYAKSRYVIPGSTSEELIPNGVKYQMLGVLMLNELKKHENKITDINQKVKDLQTENEQLKQKLENTENNYQKLQSEIDQIKQLLKKKRNIKLTENQAK